MAAPVLVIAAPAFAQDADGRQVSAEDAIEQSRDFYGPAAPMEDCPDAEAGIISNEIIICAEKRDNSQFRIRSEEDAESDYAAETMNVGNPQAPDVAGAGIFRGPATAGGMCFVPPCPKPVMPDIDFAAIPEAPPGSDADRVGRGLAPRGNDDAVIDDETPQTEEAPETGALPSE